ncbi:MAG: adenylosuccinate synthase, partial [Coriobacteriales bacterium]|nr:adenylosuccinate synthase [Coriobacteriales bacterium]
APDYDYVVRYQGGNNAGHTVIHDDIHLALHLIPSGIMFPEVIPVIGNGCVIDPRVLLQEMDTLAALNISTERLLISGNAHLIMPWHLALDAASETRLGANEIGTTKRGIGPAYEQKISRSGIRVQDLLDTDTFRRRVASALDQANAVLTLVYGQEPFDAQAVANEYLEYGQRIIPHIADSALLLNSELKQAKQVLFEGAQGTLLDIDHGTYPYVTSSSCTAGGALIGSGVGPTAIQKVLGIAKAYITRVGSGPFPTEQQNEIGEQLVKAGGEYGTTTGRIRRCGWHDAVITRYAASINGLTDLCITKLDVLSSFQTIKVCVAYEYAGQRYSTMPNSQTVFEQANPVYEEWPGWLEDISACRNYQDLPAAARAYLNRLEELAEVPVTIISVGPEREQTILHGWQSS